MAQKVTLDALIPREDFDINDGKTNSQQGQRVDRIDVGSLKSGSFFYTSLRKPDFQRETSDWSPENIAGFVQSFVNGDLIPAVILWAAGRYVFVMDGAHRLSALIAWVQDDYGDGVISGAYFGTQISTAQKKIAERTRAIVKQSVGSYADLHRALEQRDRANPKLVDRAMMLGSLAIQLQWVVGDAKKAEDSFFKINQRAVAITPVELNLLKNRRQARALASRAIVRAGTGHNYWSHFDEKVLARIKDLATEVHHGLFTPELATPIRTLDLPLGGRGYAADSLPLVYDFVNECNPRTGVSPPRATSQDAASSISVPTPTSDDADGEETIRALERCVAVVRRVCGNNGGSLGLHPAIYFYGANGRYQPTAFLAWTSLLKVDASRPLELNRFTKWRQVFEDYLSRHKAFINQAVRKFGSGTKGAPNLAELMLKILELVEAHGGDEGKVTDALLKHEKFSFLQPLEKDELADSEEPEFSTAVKSAAFLREALKNPLRCSICGGFLHGPAITVDHDLRKEDGGKGGVNNAKLAHAYCNTTYKN